MVNRKYCKLVYAIFILVGFAFIGSCKAESSRVITLIVNNNSYYHLKFSLSKENIASIDLLTKEEMILRRGLFEVFLKKAAFPIEAPFCKSNLILRMPGTDSDYTDSEKFIEEKLDIYNSIRNLLESKGKVTKDVYIELNPYVKVNNGEFQLTQCNIFFRQAYARYIPKVGDK